MIDLSREESYFKITEILSPPKIVILNTLTEPLDESREID